VRFRWSISALLTAAFLLVRSEAASVARTEIPFQFREGLIWVPVRVPQSGETLSFLLDTGASVSVIDFQTVNRLGLKSGTPVTVHGVQNSAEGYWPINVKATANGVPLPKDFLAVDLSRLSLACDAPVEGLIGADFFHGRVVQIDFAEGKIHLLKVYKPCADAEVLALETRPCGIRASIGVNGGPSQWVRLDTGCASALQLVTAAVHPEECSRRIAIGLAAVSIAQTSTTVRLGKLTFADVPTGIHTNEIFAGESGLLGNGLLSRFRQVTIDTGKHRLVLER
jgi:hypothetical protein